jgi:hypothetical protein
LAALKGLAAEPDGYINVMWPTVEALHTPEGQEWTRQIISWVRPCRICSAVQSSGSFRPAEARTQRRRLRRHSALAAGANTL